jgi:CheY-like chemotaxis protein
MADTRLKDIKVVAVDDDPDARELLTVILKTSGAEATVAASGQEALSMIRTVHPDVFISDLGMPGMDGYELIKNVRQLSYKIGSVPSIAVSGSVRNEERVCSLRAGFTIHLTKPVDPDALVTAIRDLVETRRGA